MPKNVLLIIAVTFMLTSPAYAASFNIVAQVIATVGITRTLPSPVNTNQPFDVGLNFSNLVDLELSNISIKETIPVGYKIINKVKISPTPTYVGNENGATVIYWNISRMANYSNLSIKYSLSAPKSAGSYTFRANASCFDASGNMFAAYNVTVQMVKSTLLQSILGFFGIYRQ